MTKTIVTIVVVCWILSVLLVIGMARKSEEYQTQIQQKDREIAELKKTKNPELLSPGSSIVTLQGRYYLTLYGDRNVSIKSVTPLQGGATYFDISNGNQKVSIEITRDAR